MHSHSCCVPELGPTGSGSLALSSHFSLYVKTFRGFIFLKFLYSSLPYFYHALITCNSLLCGVKFSEYKISIFLGPLLYWVGQKVCLVFFSIIKDRHIFHFHQYLYWFGYFEYVGSLLLLASSGQRPGVLLNIFQCIRQPHSKELFGQMSIIPRNFANHFWHVPSVTAPSPYTAQIFSCVSVAFFLK